jgi:hypothetical protein
MLDCVRFRDELGTDAVVGALQAGLARGAFDLPTLLARAKLTKVHKPLTTLINEALSTQAAAVH